MSTRGSVEGANDNEALTLRTIERDDTDQRVYNFAVQSPPGEVTHNYLVGDREWWTHNVRVVKDGPVEIVYYPGDHGPPHVHVKGGGPETRVGQNCKRANKRTDPLPTPRQAVVLQRHKSLIRRFLKKVIRGYSND